MGRNRRLCRVGRDYRPRGGIRMWTDRPYRKSITIKLAYQCMLAIIAIRRAFMLFWPMQKGPACGQQAGSGGHQRAPFTPVCPPGPPPPHERPVCACCAHQYPPHAQKAEKCQVAGNSKNAKRAGFVGVLSPRRVGELAKRPHPWYM